MQITNNIKQIPNYLTFTRVVLIPVLLLTYFALPDPWDNWVSAYVFITAAITDWLDGFLARKLDTTSRFGAFLDPVADKLMVAFALICLSVNYATVWFVIPAGIIICREITISALREWMAEIGKSSSVAVAYIGMVKTTVQMLSISLLLWEKPLFSQDIAFIGLLTLYVAAALTVWSMLVYFSAARRQIQVRPDNQE